MNATGPVDRADAHTVTPGRTVWLVARRELNTRLRTKAFAISTIVILVLMAGYMFLQAQLAANSDKLDVGLSGQASALSTQLVDAAKQFDKTVEVVEITNPADGEVKVRDGDLDALVSGTPSALEVTAKSALDDTLRKVLNVLVQQQTLNGQLAEAGLNPKQVQQKVAATTVDVKTLTPADPQRGQRVAVGIVVAVLLYFSLVVYGTTVAQGVVEEKSSRVVEVLLATIRPWQLLLGKVFGLGLVGLIQIAILAVVGLVAANLTGALTLTSATVGAAGFGVIWYVLGFFLYATVFAAAASLVSRQEDMQQVLTPITMVIVIAFLLGISLLGQAPDSTATIVLSLLPPFAPIMMPGRIALGGVADWQVVLALVLAAAGIAAVTWLGGKIYNNAVLRTGSRVKLREALG